MIMTSPILAKYPQVRSSPLSMAMLCTMLRDRGLMDDAVELGLAAVEAAPDNLEVRDLVAVTLSRGVPKWHVPMLNDHERNRCYRVALERAIKPGMIVLEIGTGAGLLSLIAARLGARVYTCEANGIVAGAARLIARHNKLDDRITIISKLSSDLRIGEDLPERADLLMSELFDDTLFGDGIVQFIDDARQRLLKPDATILPQKAELRLCLASFQVPEKHKPLGRVEGFDLSAFNVLAPRASSHLRAAKIGAEPRSEPLSALRKDFAGSAPFGEDSARLEFVSSGGQVDGVAQWLRVEFFDDLIFENSPFTPAPRSHWGSPLTPLASPLATDAGQRIAVGVRRVDREILLDLSGA
jgi:type II protein arginine methyltransferase